MTQTRKNTIQLPSNFIGVEDEAKLESFASHLISHGRACRWSWERSNGVAKRLYIFAHDEDMEVLVTEVLRDSSRDLYCARDQSNAVQAEGTLEHVMTVIDDLTRGTAPDPSA